MIVASCTLGTDITRFVVDVYPPLTCDESWEFLFVPELFEMGSFQILSPEVHFYHHLAHVVAVWIATSARVEGGRFPVSAIGRAETRIKRLHGRQC